MAHFAEINENNVVVAVYSVNDAAIVKNGKEDEEKGNTLMQSITGKKSKFIQTSYNTKGGIHYAREGKQSEFQEKAMRKNYAGVGYYYDQQLDAFIPPQPFPSWVLDEKKCVWEAPKACPQMGEYYWDESKLDWVESAISE